MLISVMHRSSLQSSWPIISLSTSSLSCCAVICSVSCSKGMVFWALLAEFREDATGGVQRVQNLSCGALPKLPALGRTGIL